ncbi:DUF6452 family protein [Confluentibacter flavum]|uniref:DUF1735 domain-containing protein n=1 Tax=Confluentibacter flavum TaxID=1909700 RepID=A0A2N3HGM8_9FLAO|nr:DUF6452 family protein [Confluentibacter flavum]PKQ44129.1 hypothetical protein CSW08_15160 [Confluentibacter flavum]
MKKISLLLILLLAIGIIISCERDDICPESTPTTPKLIIEFYDSANPESVKFVPQIRVQGVNNDGVLEGYNAANVQKLELPLRTDTTATQYRLHRNYSINNGGTPDDPSDDFPNGNEDIITIKYTTEQVFVSRACGYKTVFKNVSLTIEPDTNPDNWILSRQSVTDNQSVEDETTAHFYLFF